MTISLVQSVADGSVNTTTGLSATWPSTPTEGNLLIASMSIRGTKNTFVEVPSGWSQICAVSSNGCWINLFTKVAGASEEDTPAWNWQSNYKRIVLSEWSGVGGIDVSDTLDAQSSATSHSIGPVTPTSGVEALVYAGFLKNVSDSNYAEFTEGSGYTELDDSKVYPILGPRHEVEYKIVGSTTGSYSADCTQSQNKGWGAYIAIFTAAAEPPPDPDPPPDPEPGVVVGPDDPEVGVDITGDVIGWRVTRGSSPEITGGASPGAATITVKNSDRKYDPEYSSSPLYGKLTDGLGIWIGVNSDGVLTGDDPRGIFGGRLTDITQIPSPGATVPPTAELGAEDFLGWGNRTEVEVPSTAGLSHAELRELILTAAGETRYSLAHEIRTMPLASAEGMATSALEAINKANGTRHFVKPMDNFTDWYQYTTRNRQWRLDGTSDADIDQGDDHVTAMNGWRLSGDTVINRQKASITPIRFTPQQVTVWRYDRLPRRVSNKRPLDVWIEFDDFVENATVDVLYTGDEPTVAYDHFGTTGHLVITNDGSDVTKFRRLSIEGSIARRLPDQSHIAEDLTSQGGSRGVRAGGDISGAYVGVLATATGIAEHVVWRYGNPQLRPTITVENWFPYMFDIDLFDIIAYTSTQQNVADRLFEVVGLTHESDVAATNAVHHTVTYVLQECRVQSDPGWFILDTSTLDGDDVLAY